MVSVWVVGYGRADIEIFADEAAARGAAAAAADWSPDDPGQNYADPWVRRAEVIGTPPEPSERERLLREALAARLATLAPTDIATNPDWRRELCASRAYLDHIIAEEDADAAR